MVFFFNQKVYLMASLHTKAARGELFPKTRGLKVEAECLERGQVKSALQQLLLQGKDGVGLFLENS